MRKLPCLCCALILCSAYARAQAQVSLTWEQVRNRFEANNPTLLADKLNIDESRAQEITAYLRPNPDLTLTADGTQIAPDKGVWRPFAGTFESPAISYLHERRHKRELRLESVKKATLIAESSHADLERTLLFNLRSAFVSTLQAKAVLQRVQYESDLQNAEESLENAKIQLLTLLNSRIPLDEVDVTGLYDFVDQLMPRDDFRKIALDTRPDLKSAIQAVDKAQT